MSKRKTILAISVIAVATIVSVAVVSCKKEKQDTASSNKTEQIVPSVNNMDEYLISFKNKLLSAQKGDEIISLEQAQHDLSNLLNFDFGDVNYATNVFVEDTLYSKLKLTNGQVDLSQLAVTYKSVVESVSNVYKETVLPEKSVYSIICSIANSTAKDEIVDVEIILTLRGYSQDANIRDSYEYWRPQYLGGTCDGHLVGYCGGAKLVESWLNNQILLPECLNGRGYFTDIDWSYKDGYADDMIYDNPNSNILYRLYVSFQFDQNNVCLPYATLVFYYNQAKNLRYNSNIVFSEPIPSNHTSLQYTVFHHPRGYGIDQTPLLPWMWTLGIKHGMLNCTGIEPIV